MYVCLRACVHVCAWQGKYAALNCTFPSGCLDNLKKSFKRKCDDSDICSYKFYLIL